MSIPNKIVGLSPMAGYTDSPFRALIRTMCPKVMLVTELISADGLKFCSQKTEDMMKHFENEKPLTIQLFWKHPEFFAEAAKKAELAWGSCIDINMGCPAKKVIHSGHWSALIKTPELAYEIVKKTVEATKLPVTVKTRLWWTRDNKTQEELTEDLIKFCKWLEKAWAKHICIHGRTVKQWYNWTADWEPIYEVKKHLNIPIIWNWDISTSQDAINKIKNLDWIFIGRWTIWKPWLIPQIYAAINWLEIPKDPTLLEIIPLAIKHAELAWEMKWKRWMFEMRKNLVMYLKWFKYASTFRQKLVHVECVEDVKKVLDEVKKIINCEL